MGAMKLPELIGGSADLAPSNMTLMKCTGDFLKDSYEGRNMRFGIREFGMGAVCNKADSHDAHGAPLGSEEAQATRDNLGWKYGEFEVPDSFDDVFKKNAADGAKK